MQTRCVEERLHERNGFGTGIGVALLSEWNIRVKAGVVGTGHIGIRLGLEVDECEGGYMDKCKRGKSPVLALVQDR